MYESANGTETVTKAAQVRSEIHEAAVSFPINSYLGLFYAEIAVDGNSVYVPVQSPDLTEGQKVRVEISRRDTDSFLHTEVLK